MKKILVSAVFLLMGIATSFAETMERSVTYNVSSAGEITVTGDELTGSVAEFTNTCSIKTKMYANDFCTLTLKNYDGYIITGLTLEMASNKDGGAGTFSFMCGDDEIASIKDASRNWFGVGFADDESGYNVHKDVRVQFNSYIVEKDKDLIITITATEDALYIYGYTITYQKAEDRPMITLTNGDLFYRRQQVNISYEADVIYFTTDGTEPTTASQKYDENVPIYIDKETTIKAFAVKGDEQTKVSTKTFEKEPIKAIVAHYTNNDDIYYGMTKTNLSGHLAPKACTIYNNVVPCNPEDFLTYAWRFNDDGKIQDCESLKYLLYTKDEKDNNTDIQLSDKSDTKWILSGTDIIPTNNSERLLSYYSSYTNKYFGAYKKTASSSYPAYPLDLIKGYIRDGLSPNKIGTICLPYDVLNDDRMGATFYNILGKKTDENGNVESLILEEETETLIAGKPYIFEATDNALCCMYLDYVEKEDAAQAGGNHNGLYGSLEGRNVEKGMYLVTNNSIVKCGDNCSISANRAYINMEDVDELNEAQQLSGRMLTISIGGGDLTNIEAAAIENTNNTVIYNMQGQRVVAPAKGVYIVNGKKTIIK